MKEFAGLILIVPAILLVGVVALAVYRFMQFWIGFARGINEASPKPRGFEVKQPTGGTPVLHEEKDQNHG